MIARCKTNMDTIVKKYWRTYYFARLLKTSKNNNCMPILVFATVLHDDCCVFHRCCQTFHSLNSNMIQWCCIVKREHWDLVSTLFEICKCWITVRLSVVGWCCRYIYASFSYVGNLVIFTSFNMLFIMTLWASTFPEPVIMQNTQLLYTRKHMHR